MHRYTTLIVPRRSVNAVLILAALVLITPQLIFGQDNAPDVVLKLVGVLDLSPPLPEEGEDVQVGMLVENSGTRDARDVPVYFYEDGVYFDKVVIDIRAGDTVYVEAYWTADPGDSYLSVTVDPAGGYDTERNENSTGTWVTVR